MEAPRKIVTEETGGIKDKPVEQKKATLISMLTVPPKHLTLVNIKFGGP